MPSSKIVQFPSKGRSFGKRPDAAAELFAATAQGRGKIVYLPIEQLSEENFLHLIARNGVTGIIDLRPKPVFQTPHFEHRKVIEYFYARHISYFEYALFLQASRSSVLKRSVENKARVTVGKLLDKGLTLCLYDETAKARGWLGRARGTLVSNPQFVAELHPRALNGVYGPVAASAPGLTVP